MGLKAWFWLRATNARLHDEVAALQERNKVLEASEERLDRELKLAHEVIKDTDRTARRYQGLTEQLTVEKGLLIRMLNEHIEAEHDVDILRDRLVRLERHNAVYETSVEWAVSHINTIAAERAHLIARMTTPTTGIEAFQPPLMQFQPAQNEPVPPAPVMAPPPGPIRPAGIVGGVPIPDGKTAGDVINALREKRARDVAQDNEQSAEETLRRAAELFEDDPALEGDQASAHADPFADIP